MPSSLDPDNLEVWMSFPRLNFCGPGSFHSPPHVADMAGAGGDRGRGKGEGLRPPAYLGSLPTPVPFATSPLPSAPLLSYFAAISICKKPNSFSGFLKN